jgi:hypothetical protein
MKCTTVFWRQDGSQSSGTHLEIQRSFPCRVQLSTCPLFVCLKRGNDPLVFVVVFKRWAKPKYRMTQNVLYHRQNTKELCHPPSLSFAYSNWTSFRLRFSLFWDVTQRRLVVVPEQSIGPICKGTLRDVSEQRRPPISSGERLKSEKFHIHSHSHTHTRTRTHAHIKWVNSFVLYWQGVYSADWMTTYSQMKQQTFPQFSLPYVLRKGNEISVTFVQTLVELKTVTRNTGRTTRDLVI